MNILDQLISIIAPHSCLGCGREGASLCTTCASALPVVPDRCFRCQTLSAGCRTCPACRRTNLVYAVRPATVYDAAAKALVHAVKFDRALAGAHDIARSIASRANLPAGVILTHVPTVPQRIRIRGYDQAQLIARALAHYLNRPYLPLLARQGAQRQVGQQRAVRMQQMEHAFRAVNPSAATSRHIVLVDDVITTGSTISSAARILRAAGAARVSAVVFAAA